ncbi:MAG: hypothetical protein ACHQAQ_20065, partial [Hyphomicrobiales bacterium]
MRQRTAILVALIAGCFFGICLFGAAPSLAKDASPPPAPAAASGEPPPRVRELLELLGDPQVRAWLDQRKGAGGVRSDASSSEVPAAHGESVGLNEVLARLGQVQAHFAALFAAMPNVADDFGVAAEMLAAEFKQQELLHMLRLLALFVGLGYGMEWLFRRATLRFRVR